MPTLRAWLPAILAASGLNLSLAMAGDAACAADLDGDGVVGAGDLAELLAAWGDNPGNPADFNGDDVVDAEDLATLLAAWNEVCVGGPPTAIQLAGRTLADYPYFTPVREFNRGTPIKMSIDPAQRPELVGVTADLYLVPSRTADEWDANGTLNDISADGADEATFIDGSIADNVFTVEPGTLNGDVGIDLGAPYDLVIDVNRNGTLDAGDYIDGYGDEAGLYVFVNMTLNGPLEVEEMTYSGGSFLGQRTFYPADIDSMGAVPLIVISHGNGHQYTWYEYLQRHLASFGYVVMSHQNNTQPGIESASTTTLTNTQYIINNQDTIGGGVLDGHLDTSRIVWIGHSRGGEGVCRAYDRVRDGSWNPDGFELSDIVLISSIAPTDFLGTFSANPWEATYHLIYGAADGDVSGTPQSDVADSFNLFERATDYRQSSYVHGADHNDFNCCGFNDFQGPSGTQIGRTAAQGIAKANYLALIKHYVDGNIPCKDYLWRQYEDLRSVGLSGTFTVVRDYREERDPALFIVDNYQSNSSSGTSSSGGSVLFDVLNITEGIINDNNTSFTWQSSDPMNGMTRGRGSDSTRGTVFNWASPSFYEYEIVNGKRDVSGFDFLGMRACQGTRHPDTVSALEDLNFSVTLRDEDGTTSTINIGVYGGGVEEPYQRTGAGSGAGWQNEFEVIRIRLTDFITDGSGLDLTRIDLVRLDFGGASGSDRGRIGLDEVRFTYE